jgi:hypothetical protein
LVAVALLEGDCHFAIMGGDFHGGEKLEAVRSGGLYGFCSSELFYVPATT